MKQIIAIIIIMILAAATAQADVRKIKFVNGEGKEVDDLHIEFKNNIVEWDRNSPHTFDNVKHQPGSTKYDFWGTPLAAGDTAELTFESVNSIDIKEWWWTKGGTAVKIGDQIGKKKADNGGNVLTFNGGAAAGNGLCRVSAGGTQAFFNYMPGLMPDQTAASFMAFLQVNFNSRPEPLVYASLRTPSSLYVAGNIEGDTTTPLKIEILQTDLGQPMSLQPVLPLILSITALIEGRYTPGTNKMKRDYVDVYFRSSTPPYTVLSSDICFLDSLGKGDAWTYDVSNGLPFYIQIGHRNSVETWSAGGNNIFVNGRCAYNFTSSRNSAFGSNLKQMGSRFCIYSGDSNQDGLVDGTDLSAVDNDAANYVTGYVPTDLTGDEAVDATDYAITDNNANAFVGVMRP